MDVYMTAPEGDSLTPQELIDLLVKARIKVDDWGIVSEEPLEIEGTLENRSSVVSARGTGGRLRFVSIAMSVASIIEGPRVSLRDGFRGRYDAFPFPLLRGRNAGTTEVGLPRTASSWMASRTRRENPRLLRNLARRFATNDHGAATPGQCSTVAM
jgi:hypothetical protein